MKVTGTNVLVTGGGRGIGRHLVEQLDGVGANVFVLEYDENLCEELNQLASGRVRAVRCDVANADAVDVAIQTVTDSGFEIDVLINNAGIIHSEPLVNMLSRTERAHSRDNWRKVMATDLDSVFFVTSRVVDHMLVKRKKGVVISISSIAANGNAGQSAYSAAKAGVNALTHTWAKELGPLGLRFIAIAPGFIDTPSTRTALSETMLAKLQQQVPLRRLGGMQAVSQAVHYAIENDYLTGSILEVDGGLVL
ncbi:MAG: SDR family NAD(P)-dependent oxidoreductase [Undibacterium umbellatum]|uniref:SDR family NAD(P)-dependent oxidoreductase n=1 Tax=Undibacterium umbellatum TaxID=2762300 RepID=UPI003BB4EA5F